MSQFKWLIIPHLKSFPFSAQLLTTSATNELALCAEIIAFAKFLSARSTNCEGALSDDDAYRLSPIAHMWDLYENCQTNQRDKLGQRWDDESRKPDAVF